VHKKGGFGGVTGGPYNMGGTKHDTGHREHHRPKKRAGTKGEIKTGKKSKKVRGEIQGGGTSKKKYYGLGNTLNGLKWEGLKNHESLVATARGSGVRGHKKKEKRKRWTAVGKNKKRAQQKELYTSKTKVKWKSCKKMDKKGTDNLRHKHTVSDVGAKLKIRGQKCRTDKTEKKKSRKKNRQDIKAGV